LGNTTCIVCFCTIILPDGSILSSTGMKWYISSPLDYAVRSNNQYDLGKWIERKLKPWTDLWGFSIHNGQGKIWPVKEMRLARPRVADQTGEMFERFKWSERRGRVGSWRKLSRMFNLD
jgi:hypothetical protein